ncbi:MAG TPA: FAD-binding oxidoreductase [Anaerovoracaceae bacterium]|nr:FAD-binding oxidoreductase [Anaerovoracaceae bacterium]
MVSNIKDKLIEIMGSENVADSAEILESYQTDQSFVNGIRPWFVTKPRNAGQVQDLVKWANETGTSLVPVSSGDPHYKGDTIPNAPQSVIVDLSGMNRILSINRRQRMAVVEPGVTYGQLQEALAKEGLALSTSLAPKKNKSVVTSVLEVEPRLNANHQWSYVDPLRCMEVTWGDGNTMFTGEAGGGVRDLEKQWADQRWQLSGNGPNMFDFIRALTQAQGSMGIVTWASLKCEVCPTVHKMYFVPSDHIETLTGFVRRVIHFRFSDELMVMNGAYLAELVGESAEEILELKSRLPKWIALIGVLGRELLPEQRVKQQAGDIGEIAGQFGLQMVEALQGVRGEKALSKAINASGEVYWKEAAKGAFQDIFFVTALDKAGTFIDAMYRLAEETGYPAKDVGVYIQPQHCGSSYHLEFHLPYNPTDSEETATVRTLYDKGSKKMSDLGAFYSRPYNSWAKLQMNKDAQSYIALKKLKGIFDPNNIMNTGKLTV